MRISDWSSDVCSSDLNHRGLSRRAREVRARQGEPGGATVAGERSGLSHDACRTLQHTAVGARIGNVRRLGQRLRAGPTDKGIAIGAAQLLDAIERRDGDANVARRVIIVPLLTNLYFLASARRVADVLAELGAPGVLIDRKSTRLNSSH